MTPRYKIFGNYGYKDQCCLNEGMSREESIRWADKYAASEDMGGYDIIEVAFFQTDGEYVVSHTIRKEEDY